MSSRQSQNRNGAGNTAKSVGKANSVNSFAQSKASGLGTTTKSGTFGPNIVIDIESENLTYNQARSIRLQLQRDVEQLRNRVRMLQNEEMRAIKKIDETRKKTRQLQDLQQKNDDKVLKKQREDQQRMQKAEQDRLDMQKRREREKQQINIRNQNFREQKLQAVDEVRRQKEQMKHNLYGIREDSYNNAQFRKQQIRSQKAEGLAKQNEFIKQKRTMARQDIIRNNDNMKNQIMDYEKESMELERLENELLAKLQETQVQERAAFQRLENAMVDGSIPPIMRAEQSMISQSQVNGSSQYQQENMNNSRQGNTSPNKIEDGASVEKQPE